jgi:hypothetical protein
MLKTLFLIDPTLKMESEDFPMGFRLHCRSFEAYLCSGTDKRLYMKRSCLACCLLSLFPHISCLGNTRNVSILLLLFISNPHYTEVQYVEYHEEKHIKMQRKSI